MPRTTELQEDLHFVRGVVTRHDRQPLPGTAGIYLVWAAYTLIGYTLIDVAPRWANPFFGFGGLVAGVISMIIGYRATRRSGEWDPQRRRQVTLHWGGGVVLAIFASVALCTVIPPLREKTYAGQITVVMIGIVYFLAGVHFDRSFLWLGPILIVGGIVVGVIPHFGWAALGAVIALGLVVTSLLQMRNPPVAA